MTLNRANLLTFVKEHAPGLHHEVPVPELTPVLIVDDEESVRCLVARILGPAGFAPVLACGGPDALAKVAGLDRCPVLVTDMMMPDMTGNELARRLRAANPELKVLYLTGFADRLFAERPMLWEDEAFLEKPFTANGLLEAMALLTTGHPAVGALSQVAPAAGR